MVRTWILHKLAHFWKKLCLNGLISKLFLFVWSALSEYLQFDFLFEGAHIWGWRRSIELFLWCENRASTSSSSLIRCLSSSIWSGCELDGWFCDNILAWSFVSNLLDFVRSQLFYIIGLNHSTLSVNALI